MCLRVVITRRAEWPNAVFRSGPRHVFLYSVTREVPAGFRMFLFRHAELLKMVKMKALASRRNS